MKSKPSRNIGQQGEEIAATFLQSKNYQIQTKNYRWARGEIDIIARKDNVLIFVEVKTAGGTSFGPPEAWVNKKKQRQIGMVAEHYLQQNEIENVDCRFDVIGIEFQHGDWRVNHIENAFWLEA